MSLQTMSTSGTHAAKTQYELADRAKVSSFPSSPRPNHWFSGQTTIQAPLLANLAASWAVYVTSSAFLATGADFLSLMLGRVYISSGDMAVMLAPRWENDAASLAV